MTRIFHLSDIHFGLEHPEAVAWARSCIERERPDAVCITGDLTMRARHREYTAACEWVTSLDDPVTVVRFSQIVENPPDFQDRLRGVGGAQN